MIGSAVQLNRDATHEIEELFDAQLARARVCKCLLVAQAQIDHQQLPSTDRCRPSSSPHLGPS